MDFPKGGYDIEIDKSGEIGKKLLEQAKKDLREWFNKFIFNNKQERYEMNSDTANYNSSDYGRVKNHLLDVPRVTLLDSMKVMVDQMYEEVNTKGRTIEKNYELQILWKDKQIEELNYKMKGFDEVLNLIPIYRDETNSYYSKPNPLAKAKEWILRQLGPKETTEDKMLFEYKAKILELNEKLNHIENKTISSEIIKLSIGKKLVSLTDYSKKNKILGGEMLNVVINVPDGFEIDKVVLKRKK